jgi:hypothetical protein
MCESVIQGSRLSIGVELHARVESPGLSDPARRHRPLHPLLNRGPVDVLGGNAFVDPVDQQRHGARRCWVAGLFKLGADCEQSGGDRDHLGISRHRRMQASLQNRGRFTTLSVSPIDQHVACIAERCAQVGLGVLMHQALMCAGRAKYPRPGLQVDLVVNHVGRWSDPASVTVTHGDVCGQEAVDRFVYSSARHASLA